jgi:hypothetical protein
MLTTPVLGGSSGLPSDALLDLCLQVGVCRVALTCLECIHEIYFICVLFLFYLFAVEEASSEAADESHHRHSPSLVGANGAWWPRPRHRY